MDVAVIETGNGGDIYKNGSDLAMVFSFENMPYLALFGGNKEAVTRKRLDGEQAFDWWGNTLLLVNSPSIQFNSLTEKTLETVALTSAGRLIIESAIKEDLEFMKPFADISVTTEIVATDILKIGISIKEPDNLQEKQFIYIWEAGRLSFAGSQYIPSPVIIDQEELQYELEFYL